jgi:hypothetical protein
MADQTEIVNEISQDEMAELLGTPGAEVAINQSEEEKPKNVFTPSENITDYLNDPKKETTEIKKETTEENKNPEDTLDDILNDAEQKIEEQSSSTGLVSFFKKQIENQKMNVFDDFDESKETLDEYLNKLKPDELEALYEENLNSIRQEVEEKTPVEFFEMLPRELQYAAKYVSDGGKDLKSLFNTLARSEETRSLNPETEDGQKSIIKEYLSATNFGTPEEIESEIETWSDIGKLKDKADQFKPKLDKMQEQIIERKLKEQEQRKQKQIEASNNYKKTIYDTLAKGELNGIKLNPSIQNMLFKSLTEPVHISINGNNTNLFGHLIEKYQYLEPRLDLISEATWLLADPEGYKNSIKQMGSNEQNEKIVRSLKTEQYNKQSNSSATPELNKNAKSGKIANPGKRFFEF